MSKAVYETKHARGVILSTLQAYYPNGLSGGSIHAHGLRPVFPNMGWEAASRHIFYLKSRQLIEPIRESGIREVDSLQQVVFRLTPAGVDVAAGVREDDGVLIEV